MRFSQFFGVMFWLFSQVGYTATDFINDVPESEMMKLADYIIIPNKTYVNNNIIPNISSICSR
jgi:hypothetical protein